MRSELVSAIDVAPTILSAFGIAKNPIGLDGRDLAAGLGARSLLMRHDPTSVNPFIVRGMVNDEWDHFLDGSGSPDCSPGTRAACVLDAFAKLDDPRVVSGKLNLRFETVQEPPSTRLAFHRFERYIDGSPPWWPPHWSGHGRFNRPLQTAEELV